MARDGEPPGVVAVDKAEQMFLAPGGRWSCHVALAPIGETTLMLP
jgi:hypothetical protein